jgi:quercetin dioxygenase-like cupin family protein
MLSSNGEGTTIMASMTDIRDAGAGVVFGADEPGSNVEGSPGVRVQPLLATDGGSNVDFFFLTLECDAEVTRESHPYGETLVVLAGELTCSTGEEEPLRVRAGEVWHTPANSWHHVTNTGGVVARIAMHLRYL